MQFNFVSRRECFVAEDHSRRLVFLHVLLFDITEAQQNRCLCFGQHLL